MERLAWKLHRIQQGDRVIVELYNLADDPLEENDLARKNKRRASKMFKELEQWQASVYDSWEGKDH